MAETEQVETIKPSEAYESLTDDLEMLGKWNYVVKQKTLFYYSPKSHFWDLYGDAAARQCLTLQGKKYLGKLISTQKTNQLVEYLKRSHQVREVAWNTNTDYIPVANGDLNLTEGTIDPPDPDRNFTYRLPFEYNPGKIIKTPVWTKFLEVHIPNASHRKILQRYAGYSLLSSNAFHTILTLLGPTRTGKSTVIYVLGGLVGGDKTTNLNLSDLNKGYTHATSKLLNKLLVSCHELPKNALKELTIISDLASNSVLSVNPKGKVLYDANNISHIVLATNDLPKIPRGAAHQTLRAFFQRALKIDFENTLIKQIKNYHLTLLKNEGEGIFQWAANGLMDLIKEDSFGQTESAKETLEIEWTSKNRPTWEFVNEGHLLIDPEAQISLRQLVWEFNKWAAMEGCEEIQDNRARYFIRDILSHPKLAHITRKQRSVDGKRTMFYHGFGIIPNKQPTLDFQRIE